MRSRCVLDARRLDLGRILHGRCPAIKGEHRTLNIEHPTSNDRLARGAALPQQLGWSAIRLSGRHDTVSSADRNVRLLRPIEMSAWRSSGFTPWMVWRWTIRLVSHTT